ncbi:MAG: glycosyltransferase [Planctomyces sp.]
MSVRKGAGSMHILFLHHNFPAQFGQVAMHLARTRNFRCTFLSEQPSSGIPEIQQLQYTPKSGARAENHYCSRTFENQIWRTHAAFETLKQHPEIKPDLIVAHSGFVSSLYLRELYPDVPHIGYLEFFYHRHNSDLDFRTDLPQGSVDDMLRGITRNAILLLDLQNCDAGYSPTAFQRSQLPAEFQPKVETIFDGIDTDFWKLAASPSRSIGEITIPAGMKVVTYVSRGLESMRGFDIMLRAADQICRRRSDVVVLIVGEDRIAYGGDQRFTGGLSFKNWVIQKYQPDLTRIHFVGRLPPNQLVEVLSLSDAHLYLTVPFVLSWSMLNAMSCGCAVIGSDTAPVRELIQSGSNGLLVDFFDIDAWVETTLSLLNDPERRASLGENARRTIESGYRIDQCLERMVSLYERTVNRPKRSTSTDKGGVHE